MKILIVVSNYPHTGHRFAGIFNERSVEALKEYCEFIAVLSPRPYVPRLLARALRIERWKAHAEAASFEERDGVPVHRPSYLQIPHVASTFWEDQGAYIFCTRMVRKLHKVHQFDAILSFGLTGTAGFASRLGKTLKIPVAGWATGTDIRRPEGSAEHRALLRTLKNLDMVFYQSHELIEVAAHIRKTSPGALSGARHVVLSRGIPEPPSLPRDKIRKRERLSLGIRDDEIIILFVGRVTRAKGMFELLEAMSLAAAHNPKLKCIIVGSKPGYDETMMVEKKLDEMSGLRHHVKVLPACDPEKVWEYLCAADLFGFPSHNEGMPNSLLEAMAMEIPSIAFAIPPVMELEAGSGGLILVPPLNPKLFADAIVRLASSTDERARIGRTGKEEVMKRFMVRNNMEKACAHLARMIRERGNSASKSTAVPKGTQRKTAFVKSTSGLDSSDNELFRPGN